MKSGASDVDNAGRHQEVDVELLQLPRQVADTAAVEPLGGGGDGVAIRSGHRTDDVRFVAKVGNRADARYVDVRPRVVSRNARTDDLVNRPRFASLLFRAWLAGK